MRRRRLCPGGKRAAAAGKAEPVPGNAGTVPGSASLHAVHQVILNVLEDTGYGAAAAAMPGGEQRQANLDMLVKKAADFESTSYHGLFQFIRYMEQMERYKVDFGEVSLYGELADTVRIMTIHKSKGLEFPVVFVCGLGSRMNLMDANAPVVFHHTLGIGADWIDLKNRTRVTPLLKEASARPSAWTPGERN